MATTVSALTPAEKAPLPANPPPTGQGSGGSHIGVFISAESLTFPTAATICATLVSGLGLFIGGAAENVWWVLAVCVVVGLLIVIMGWPIQDKKGKKTPEEKRHIVGYFVAGILNILLLFISVMGILSISTQEVPALPPLP